MTESGRYKSRILNYVIERSQKLSQQAGQRVRELRIGVVWGAQVLLYPLYAAFQTARLVGRQISGSGPASSQQPVMAPSADDVVESVLSLARELADAGAIELSQLELPQPPPPQSAQSQLGQSQSAQSEVLLRSAPVEVESSESLVPLAIAPEAVPAELGSAGDLAFRQDAFLGGVSQEEASSLNAAMQIRGVASQLDNRSLVLVDNGNRLVPLEAEQQRSLQQSIVQQVADYNYRCQRYQRLAAAQPLPLARPREQQFSAVRWMSQLMGWMQTGPVAIATNLFAEAQLPPSSMPAPPFLYWDPEPGQRLTREALTQLDSPLTQLEQRYLADPQQLEQLDAARLNAQQLLNQALFATAKLFGLSASAERWMQSRRSAEGTGASDGRMAEPQSGPFPDSDASGTGFSPRPNIAMILGLQRTLGLAQTSPPTPAATPEGLPNPPASTPSMFPVPAPIELPSPQPRGLAQLAARLTARLANRWGSLVRLQSPPLSSDAIAQGAQSSDSDGDVASHLQTATGLEQFLDNSVTSSSPVKDAPLWSRFGQTQTKSQGDQGGAINIAAPGSVTASESRMSENVTFPGKRQTPLDAAYSSRSATESSASDVDPVGLAQTSGPSVTYESPYVETTATFTGYVKHPLEWILEGLDTVLLWLESQAFRLWQWLRQAYSE